jgi:hypothetical protein
MKIKDFLKQFSNISPDDEIYATNNPSIHQKVGGIFIAEFQMLEVIGKNKGRILSFAIMTGKQDEREIVFRLETPDWFNRATVEYIKPELNKTI